MSDQLFRVTLVSKPTSRRRKAYVQVYFTVAPDAQAAKAIAMAYGHDAPSNLLRASAESWGVIGAARTYMDDDLTADPGSLPALADVEAAAVRLAEAEALQAEE